MTVVSILHNYHLNIYIYYLSSVQSQAIVYRLHSDSEFNGGYIWICQVPRKYVSIFSTNFKTDIEMFRNVLSLLIVIGGSRTHVWKLLYQLPVSKRIGCKWRHMKCALILYEYFEASISVCQWCLKTCFMIVEHSDIVKCYMANLSNKPKCIYIIYIYVCVYFEASSVFL